MKERLLDSAHALPRHVYALEPTLVHHNGPQRHPGRPQVPRRRVRLASRAGAGSAARRRPAFADGVRLMAAPGGSAAAAPARRLDLTPHGHRLSDELQCEPTMSSLANFISSKKLTRLKLT